MADAYQRALDEYQTICDYHRTEDQLKWQVLGIPYGGAGLLAVGAVNDRYSFAAVGLAAAAAAAATLGTSVYCRLSKYTIWRLERAWKLESGPLGFDHHLHLRKRHAEGRRGECRRAHREAWLLGPWVLWLGFLAVTLAKR